MVDPLAGKRCPVCGAPLYLRVGRRGSFLGCSRYPACKETRALTPEEAAEIERLHGERKAESQGDGEPAE